MERQSDLNNHADQLNPNNDAYWESRDWDERPDDWEERIERDDTLPNDDRQPPQAPRVILNPRPAAGHPVGEHCPDLGFAEADLEEHLPGVLADPRGQPRRAFLRTAHPERAVDGVGVEMRARFDLGEHVVESLTYICSSLMTSEMLWATE